jgi:hypothetical protein
MIESSITPGADGVSAFDERESARNLGAWRLRSDGEESKNKRAINALKIRILTSYVRFYYLSDQFDVLCSKNFLTNICLRQSLR